MEKAQALCRQFLNNSDADAAAFAILDFKTGEFQSFCESEINDPIWFDLASLTKPLTNGYVALKEKDKLSEFDSILNHKAGLPAWAILDRDHWKEHILSFKSVDSETLYSDLSALRFMLEAQKKLAIEYRDYLYKFWKGRLKYWLDLEEDEVTLQNGYYKSKPNFRSVHDPNAYNIKEPLSHAGVFGTIDGLAKVLLEFDQELNLLDFMQKAPRTSRFVGGFDTAEGESLAGSGYPPLTFGHLGFTGTSVWISPEKKLGWILLTNSTKHYWFNKKELNDLRRSLGESVWKES